MIQRVMYGLFEHCLDAVDERCCGGHRPLHTACGHCPARAGVRGGMVKLQVGSIFSSFLGPIVRTGLTSNAWLAKGYCVSDMLACI